MQTLWPVKNVRELLKLLSVTRVLWVSRDACISPVHLFFIEIIDYVYKTRGCFNPELAVLWNCGLLNFEDWYKFSSGP